MKTKTVLISVTLCLAAATLAFAGNEQAIRDLDAQFAKAAGAKDAAGTVSFYADDAMIMPPNAPAAKAKEAIRSFWTSMMATPGFAVSWVTTKAEMAQSGDLAYSSGTYELSENDPSGKPVKDTGKYLEVWKKQADGSWKVVVDIFNSDLPPAAPAPPSAKK